MERVLALLGQGMSASEVARATRIPRSTVRDWRLRGVTRQASECPRHDFSLLDGPTYAYLLGMYLGDGCISAHRRGVWRLRVTLDAGYPAIVAECATAIGLVAAGRRVNVLAKHGRCVEVSGYWKHWPCYLPQHGPGRKHTRSIVLTEWQSSLVEAHAESLLRGLIHSDGTTFVATERKGSYVRRAPRYAFSNRSEDILGLFRTACRIAGVHCTRASQKQIAVYSKSAVARLDEFVGPKS